MKASPISRRKAITALGLGSAAMALPLSSFARQESPTPSTFRYCLNTSTISGQNPGLLKYIDIAANAGYDGIELWVRDVESHLESGGSAECVKQREHCGQTAQIARYE